MKRLAVLAGLVACCTLGSGPAWPTTGAMLSRSFTITAEAFPVEPAPGTQQTTLGARPFATRAEATNAPPGGHAIASELDLGLIEAYTQPQGARAESNWPPTNLPADSTAGGSGMQFHAHSDNRPSSTSLADGPAAPIPTGQAGSMASSCSADGGGDALVASAHAQISNVTIGALSIASAVFDGEVSISGAGSGRAAGAVTVTGATVAGIPVIIDSTGVTVDRSKVPAAQAEALARAVTSALNQGGYMQVQVLQPRSLVSADGTSASVSGGGVFVKLTNNDPTQNYFVSFTLVGGSLRAELGGVLDAGPTEVVAAAPDTLAPPPASTPVPVALHRAGEGASAVPRSVQGAVSPRLVVSVGSGRALLPAAWSGWIWLCLAVGVVAGLASLLFLPPLLPVRRLLEAPLRRAANLYVRG